VLSLVFAPLLDATVGVPGVFAAMLVMAVGGILLVLFAVPPEPPRGAGDRPPPLSRLVELTLRPALLRLHLGMFAMHFVITATFLAVPSVLVDDLGLAKAMHWQVYLGVFVASLAGTVPLVLATERSARGSQFLLVGVLLAAASQALLAEGHAHFWAVMAGLAGFFAGFNYLEARLPALLTLAAPGTERGAALGIFATAQFLGAFAGGAVGGLLLGRFGLPGVFWGAAVVAALWALVAWPAARGVANPAEAG
jgi:predicted MFS family arabinose efflux permease